MSVGCRALALATAATLSLVGCAVQQTHRGQVTFGLDVPEMLGERLAAFKLADGSDGQLRVLSGQYSIKLQRYLKVVDIEKAQSVKLVRTEYFSDRTVLVLEKTVSNCPNRLEVLLIRGSEISSWNLGECREPLQIAREGDALYFDRVVGNRLERIVYRDERMMRLRPMALNGLEPSGTNTARASRPDSHQRRPGDPAPRHMPGLPIPAADFKVSLLSDQAQPEGQRASQPPAMATGNSSTARLDGSPRPRVDAPERQKIAPPSARPRILAGEVADDMKPIRIKLE
jgi:hypothetical protein